MRIRRGFERLPTRSTAVSLTHRTRPTRARTVTQRRARAPLAFEWTLRPQSASEQASLQRTRTDTRRPATCTDLIFSLGAFLSSGQFFGKRWTLREGKVSYSSRTEK